MKRMLMILIILSVWRTNTVQVEDTKPAGEPFSQEQIEELQSMTKVIKTDDGEMVIEKKEIAKPEYIYLEELPMSYEIQRYCQEKCKQYKVAYSFFLAFIGTESSYGTDTGTSESVIGPMQINRCNWNKYKELDVHNDYDNIEIGIRMLSELLQEYASADMVIMGYKAGENRMLDMVANHERLDACDTVVDLANYWEEKIQEVSNDK